MISVRNIVRVVVALAVPVTLLLGASTAAFAHTQDSKKRWFFTGTTYSSDSHEVSDPVNLAFMADGANRVTRDKVEQHWTDDFGGSPLAGTSMRERGCLEAAGKQDVGFIASPGSPPNYDLRDYQQSNGPGCVDQFHLRWWDDVEHESQQPVHPNEQWALAGVHFERARPGHKIAEDWDTVEAEARERMGEHCSRPTWRFHPASRGWFMDYHSDGYITMISIRHASNGC